MSIEQANKLFLLFINTYGEIFELNNKEYTFLNWDKIFSRIYKEQKVLVGTTNNRKQAIITLAELHIKKRLKRKCFTSYFKYKRYRFLDSANVYAISISSRSF